MGIFSKRSLLFLFCILAGCGSIPKPEDIPRVEPYDLAYNFECELHDALAEMDLPPDHFIYKSDIAFDLDLTTLVNHNETSSVGFMWPVSIGSVSLDLSGGLKRKKLAERHVKFAKGFDTIREMDSCVHLVGVGSRFYPVLGNIGLDESLHRFIKMHKISEARTAEDFIETLDFHLMFNEGIKPSFSLAPVATRTITGNFDHTADRDDEHKLIIVLSTRQPVAPPGIVRVQIVNSKSTQFIPEGGSSENTSPPPRIEPGSQPGSGTSREENQQRLLRSLQRERGLQLEEDIRDRLRDLDR